MTLNTILDAIRSAGTAQVRELESRAVMQAHEILSAADLEAQEIRETARETASAPAVRERARIMHHARLQSLHSLGHAREGLIDAALDQARGRLANLRADANYPLVLRQLVVDALAELSGTLEGTGQAHIQADARDGTILNRILDDLDLTLPVSYELTCWGGVIVHSDDGKVVVINTLESRLERAISYLRHYLAALFEDDHLDPDEIDQAEGNLAIA